MKLIQDPLAQRLALATAVYAALITAWAHG